MCLLVTQSATSPQLTAKWLTDFHESNADGVGVMYVENGELIVEKLLPKNPSDLITFYHAHIEGRDCAFHLRMKTHGHIDMENCHPYEVLNKQEHGIDLWLMHNGVLHTDNKADITKSDTWHYIRDYLRPMLNNNPDFAFHPAFAELIGEHIGTGNKFVLMDNLGRQVIINEEQGVYWGGRWLSNTYAWSAPAGISSSVVDDVADMKLAVEQIATDPVVYKYTGHYPYASWDYDGEIYGGYNSTYKSAYNDLDAQAEEDLEIDDILIELELAGFARAGGLSRRQAGEFVRKFGVDAFYEVSYMVMDEAIDEDWYVRIMSDFATARECFPWLEKESKQVWN
jgi:hypothetical protein